MGDIRNLEKVQRRATQLISSLENLSYNHRLQQLTLLYRHTLMDLNMTYKILHGVVSLDKTDFFILNTNHTRSNGLKIYKHWCNTTIRRTSFSQRVINDWNLLPHDIVTALNVFIFKTKLDSFYVTVVLIIYTL